MPVFAQSEEARADRNADSILVSISASCPTCASTFLNTASWITLSTVSAADSSSSASAPGSTGSMLVSSRVSVIKRKRAYETMVVLILREDRRTAALADVEYSERVDDAAASFLQAFQVICCPAPFGRGNFSAAL